MSARPARQPADYRARLDGGFIPGARCPACGFCAAPAIPRCPACRAATEPAGFAGAGVVWSSVVVHVDVGAVDPPYRLAYVDIDDGPRVLCGADPDTELPAGSVVTIEARPAPRGPALHATSASGGTR